MKKLVIRPEFITGQKINKLREYVIKYSSVHTQLLTFDIDSLISNSPHEIYSIPFCRYFFGAILGENGIFPKYYSSKTGRPSYYIGMIWKFLDSFTNIVELEDEVREKFKKIAKDPVSVVFNQEEANKCYLVYRKNSGSKEKLEKWYFDKHASFLDGTLLFIEEQPDTKTQMYTSRKIQKVFMSHSDIQEMIEYYTTAMKQIKT